MRHPDYCAPDTLDEALARLSVAAGKARVIAGGTDLVVQMRAGIAHPTLLVDLRRLPLRDIRIEGGCVVLGAGLTHTQVVESPLIAEHFPALAAACRSIGGLPTRNRGTLGGNLVNASPAADTAPALLVYDAEVTLAKLGSQRNLPLTEFFLGYRRTALEPDEILTEIRAPVPPPRTASIFVKMGRRNALAVSVVSVAARLTLNEAGRVAIARLALGSVAPTPLRAVAAEAQLEGRVLDGNLIARAACEAQACASPISDVRASAGYRLRMVEVLSRRALNTAWQRVGGG